MGLRVLFSLFLNVGVLVLVHCDCVDGRKLFGSFGRPTLQYFVKCIKLNLVTIKDVGEYDKRLASLRKLEDYIFRCWGK